MVYLEGGRFGITCRLGLTNKAIAGVASKYLRESFGDDRIRANIQGPPIYQIEADRWAVLNAEVPTRHGKYTGAELQVADGVSFADEIAPIADQIFAELSDGRRLAAFILDRGRSEGLVQPFLAAVLAVAYGEQKLLEALFAGEASITAQSGRREDDSHNQRMQNFKKIIRIHANEIKSKVL